MTPLRKVQKCLLGYLYRELDVKTLLRNIDEYKICTMPLLNNEPNQQAVFGA